MASNYDGHLVKVDTTWLPAPSTYRMTASTLVNNSRNADGVFVGSVIRTGIRKIEMTWKFLTQAQYTLIANLFETDATFVNSVYYYDTITGSYQTKNMYVGDRVSENAEIVAVKDSNGYITQINGYANVKLSLIEV